ncbi:MAG: ion transporter [Bacteroidales bacterium]|nr:ion transporter [Bacteroidales bacterium]
MGNPATTSGTPATTPAPKPKEPLSERIIFRIMHTLVLILSLLLIVYISYDTFKEIPFLSNHHYMTFQFFVCVVFLADFFITLFYSKDKKKYLRNYWFFFLVSIPYLNIINQFDIHFSHQVLYYIRFIPLFRGAYSLVLVVGFVSNNKAVSLLTQYTVILATCVYILAMLFYYEEFGVNPNVKSFWDALYWASMNMTTVGCYFSAVTPVGKIISVILPILGMMMLPLFTVYVTDRVRQHNNKTGADIA